MRTTVATHPRALTEIRKQRAASVTFSSGAPGGLACPGQAHSLSPLPATGERALGAGWRGGRGASQASVQVPPALPGTFSICPPGAPAPSRAPRPQPIYFQRPLQPPLSGSVNSRGHVSPAEQVDRREEPWPGPRPVASQLKSVGHISSSTSNSHGDWTRTRCFCSGGGFLWGPKDRM